MTVINRMLLIFLAVEQQIDYYGKMTPMHPSMTLQRTTQRPATTAL
jgi:hypothetical protein